MQSAPEDRLFLPDWPRHELAAFMTNPPHIAGQTEQFEETTRFCTRVSPDTDDMTTLYGHEQATYSRQSAAICLTLLQILIRTKGVPEHLPETFAPCRDAFMAAPSAWKQDLEYEFLEAQILTCHTPTPIEKFFNYIGYFRHLLAAASPQREQAWADFGVNRYDQESGSLTTPLQAKRYQASVQRARSGPMPGLYHQFCENRKHANMQPGITNPDTTLQQGPDQPINPQYFEIIRPVAGTATAFGALERWETLLNYDMGLDIYKTLHETMNAHFLKLFADALPPARQALECIFRIQFWFIHIMPWYRGSLAGMNMIRYVLIAYYNYRAWQENHPLLPTVPTRTGYFPDLEALLCCATEGDFVQGSSRPIIVSTTPSIAEGYC